jgi:hypothetical protein
MDQAEAIQHQLGARLPDPNEDTSAQVRRWNAAREHVAAREEYALPTPVLEPLPEGLRARGEALMQRTDVTGPFTGWDITVGVVDRDAVLSFQKAVSRIRSSAY